MADLICKIALLDEMERKWNYEIEHAGSDRSNWVIWKKEGIEKVLKGESIAYYAILGDEIIAEGTAILKNPKVTDAIDLVDDETAYLEAFRTIPEYQGKGYFSKLFNYMIDDLKKRGYKRVTIGVEPQEEKNRAIYKHYGFVNYIRDAKETYPDGTIITVKYYSKDI